MTDHQLGVDENLDGFDLELEGQSKLGQECFVFSFVVGGFEPEAERVSEQLAIGGF